MRRFLPSKFQLRERILSGLAVVLAGTATYFVDTAPPRASLNVWIEWQFIGTVFFVAVASRDRAFFTGLYCTLVSGALAGLAAVCSIVQSPWPPDWSNWATALLVLLFGAGTMAISIAIPVAFAWCVTRLIGYLERKFSSEL